jgi:hypothetical protein
LKEKPKKKTPRRKGPWDLPKNSVLRKVQTSKDPILKAKFRAWEQQKRGDAKAMERWYHDVTRG